MRSLVLGMIVVLVVACSSENTAAGPTEGDTEDGGIWVRNGRGVLELLPLEDAGAEPDGAAGAAGEGGSGGSEAGMGGAAGAAGMAGEGGSGGGSGAGTGGAAGEAGMGGEAGSGAGTGGAAEDAGALDGPGQCEVCTQYTVTASGNQYTVLEKCATGFICRATSYDPATREVTHRCFQEENTAEECSEN